jgi:hypothetical protein
VSSRRRPALENGTAEIVITCAACREGKKVARIGLDAPDAEPWITDYCPDRMEISHVRDLAALPRPAGRPRKVSIYCEAGHDIQFLIDPLVDRLRMLYRPACRTVERHSI